MEFDKSFKWGVATAAYQIEGAASEDGKGKSIWDVFCKRAGATANGQSGDVACDHYHRYREDVKLMSELSINAYRFSVSWPRVLPEGVGRVNEKGLDFYDRLTDELLHYGIEPFVTLYHWDMPYEIHKKGGFLNDEISRWFAEYADVVTRRLGDRCKNFMTINEPQCVLNLGYRQGVHAPGLKLSEKEAFDCVPNILLCHGRAAQVIRQNVRDSKLSFAACGENFYPVNDDPVLAEKTGRLNFDPLNPVSLSWFLDPVCLGKIPPELAEAYPEAFGKLTDSELALIGLPVDYLGFNIYTASGTELDGEGKLKERTPPDGAPVTAMNWQMNEECIYWMLRYLHERYKMPVLICENGAACNDWVCLDGKVHDELRVDYLKRHIGAMERAMKEGADVRGYFVWSFMDNFEWAAGYEKRFGLVHVDYQTQKRTVKESGLWYRDFIRRSRQNDKNS